MWVALDGFRRMRQPSPGKERPQGGHARQDQQANCVRGAMEPFVQPQDPARQERDREQQPGSRIELAQRHDDVGDGQPHACWMRVVAADVSPKPPLSADISQAGGRVAMAQMLSSTVVPAIALAASLQELASLVDHATDIEYLSRSAETDETSVGVQVASCIGYVSAALAGGPVPIPGIEHSR